MFLPVGKVKITLFSQAPNFLYRRVPPPDKNRSYGIQDPEGRKYPSTDQFKTTNSLTLLLDGTAGRPGTLPPTSNLM